MKITRVRPPDAMRGEIVVLVDPHDGRCKGQHSVSVAAFPQFGTMKDGQMTGTHYHATLMWDHSAGPLSVHGSREFFEAGLRACEIAEQIERDGEYRE